MNFVFSHLYPKVLTLQLTLVVILVSETQYPIQMAKIGRSLEKLMRKFKENDDPLLNLDIKLVRKEFGDKRFNELMSIINKHDPMGISHASIWEYDLEVASIIVQLDDCNTKEEIYRLVLDEFTRWFGEMKTIDLSLFEKMAVDIQDWKSKNGDRDLLGEYLSKAESFLKEKTDDSDYKAYTWYRLALVLDDQNQELDNLVFNLEFKVFGEEPSDDSFTIFDDKKE